MSESPQSAAAPEPVAAKPESSAKPAPTTGAPKPASGLPLTLGIAVAALAAGVALGTWVLGPQVARSRHVSAAPATSSAADGHAKSGKPKGKDEKLSVYRVENIIVNPSGSEGAHFLMASVAIQVEDDHVVEAMRAHDDAVRDRVISVLEKESIESLSAAGARDTLRTRIAAALASFTGSADPTHIYLPQFVIQ